MFRYNQLEYIRYLLRLQAPDCGKREEKVLSLLEKQIIEKKELPDGFSVKFNGTDEMIEAVTTFVKSERQCCNFFNFKVTINNDAFL